MGTGLEQKVVLDAIFARGEGHRDMQGVRGMSRGEYNQHT